MMSSASFSLSWAMMSRKSSKGSPVNFDLTCVSSPPTRPAKKRSFERKTSRSCAHTLYCRSLSRPSSPAKRRWMVLATPAALKAGAGAKPFRHFLSMATMPSTPATRSFTSTVSVTAGDWGSSNLGPPCCAESAKEPEKALIIWTLLGSASSRVERSWPAATMAPEASRWWILPAEVQRSDMIIFMASSSTNASPSATSAPSACK
mmetsp:Transcript_62525/g.164116  ORF Transcript_62525/g.164116 Transcript_62525/m.164116 type:complete len:205 (+) Transcript_62525:2846-3460(+)